MPPISAYVFDAYGTLFDVMSVTAACETRFPGRGAEVARLWRQKQLEYTWLRTLMGRYEDFSRPVDDGLAYAAQALGLHLSPEEREELAAEYLRLSPYPEAAQALTRLQGRPRAILSNGAPAMLEPLVRNAGLMPLLERIISVDAVRLFKPHPRVYALVPEVLGIPTDEILFVSGNHWDVSGAKSFGFQTAWVNRAGMAPDRLGQQPDFVLRTLTELPL